MVRTGHPTQGNLFMPTSQRALLTARTLHAVAQRWPHNSFWRYHRKRGRDPKGKARYIQILSFSAQFLTDTNCSPDAFLHSLDRSTRVISGNWTRRAWSGLSRGRTRTHTTLRGATLTHLRKWAPSWCTCPLPQHTAHTFSSYRLAPLF